MIDLRFVERDGKKILQWRRFISNLYRLSPGGDLIPVCDRWDEWKDVRVEKENEERKD